MMDRKIKDQIALRLHNSRVKEVISRELAALLDEKPPNISADDYRRLVGELIVSELREYLAADVPLMPPRGRSFFQQLSEPDVDLDAAVRRLATSVEYALLSGNLQMVRALGEAIAQRDTGTSKHTPRVTLYCAKLAESLEFEDHRIQALMKGSFLHDIGKIGISDAILLKRTGLSEGERQIMNSHPELGARIIGGVKWLQDALDVVRHHHERFDGTGYPDALHADQIPLNARVFAVIDVFDALTTKRPYKRAYSYDETMLMLEDGINTHFDPDIFEAFTAISRALYDDLAWESYHNLDEKLRYCLADHFKLDSTKHL